MTPTDPLRSWYWQSRWGAAHTLVVLLIGLPIIFCVVDDKRWPGMQRRLIDTEVV